jgi:hypothetical protein
MTMEYTNNECCDMPLTLGTCSSEVGTVSPMLSGRVTQKSDMERFNFKKLDEVEDRGQYEVSVSNRFAALEYWNTWTMRWISIELRKLLERM